MKKLNWKITLALVSVHACAIAGIWWFSWEGLCLCLFLWVVTAMGVTIGYHRYLTHEGFQTYVPIRWILATLGLLSGEGPPMYWVAIHRKHHQYSDEDGDPHSPRDGFWHAHMLWLFGLERVADLRQLFNKYVGKDLHEETFMHVLNRAYPWIHAVFFLLLFGAGYLYGGLYYALSFAIYGFFVRMVIVMHGTWIVNSITHTWGYRNYHTMDKSTNHVLVGVLAFGEGWHNNHHRFPRLARHGHRWWEIDTSYWVICWLKFLRLIWNVKDSIPGKT